MLPGLTYNACQHEILTLEYVNKLQHFEACVHFLASKLLLTQVRLPYERNQLVYYSKYAKYSVFVNSRDGKIIRIGDSNLKMYYALE